MPKRTNKMRKTNSPKRTKNKEVFCEEGWIIDGVVYPNHEKDNFIYDDSTDIKFDIDEKVVEELKRRCELIIKNSEPDDMATGMDGNVTMFHATLGSVGYPFAPKDWMDETFLKPLMSEMVYASSTYDDLFEELFEKAYKSVNQK